MKKLTRLTCQNACRTKILDVGSIQLCLLARRGGWHREKPGSVANDTVGLLIRQFSRGTIDASYLKKEFDFGKLTNQYTFHTERALQYLQKVGVIYDKPATGND